MSIELHIRFTVKGRGARRLLALLPLGDDSGVGVGFRGYDEQLCHGGLNTAME